MNKFPVRRTTRHANRHADEAAGSCSPPVATALHSLCRRRAGTSLDFPRHSMCHPLDDQVNGHGDSLCGERPRAWHPRLAGPFCYPHEPPIIPARNCTRIVERSYPRASEAYGVSQVAHTDSTVANCSGYVVRGKRRRRGVSSPEQMRSLAVPKMGHDSACSLVAIRSPVGRWFYGRRPDSRSTARAASASDGSRAAAWR